jgi:predicted glycosyltransferase
MNREAAVLGLPAYTIFAGALGKVDQYLIDQGRLTVLQDASQLKVDRRPRRDVRLQKSGTALLKQVTDAMLSVA